MTLTQRQEQILQSIIDTHIHDGGPVSSKALTSHFAFSPATLRNEMAELEREGYLIQPHISAGRVPTYAGYQFYVQHCLCSDRLTRAERQSLQETLEQSAFPENIKCLARGVGVMTGEMVFVAFTKYDLYITQLSNLLSKAEFQHLEVMSEVSQIVERLEACVPDIFDETHDMTIAIGKENPFLPWCSSIVGSYRLVDHTGIFGLIGHMRMDYSRNYSLLRYVRELLS